MLTVGVDMEPTARWQPFPAPLRRAFTAREHSRCQAAPHPGALYAAYWCAKEAVVKALADQLPLLPRDVEILEDDSGRPFPVLLVSSHLVGGRITLSISYQANVAMAIAVHEPAPS